MLTELGVAGVVAVLAIIGVVATGMSVLHDFPWEAAATLLAGSAAVGGAVYIGLRQTKISQGQNAILAQQLRFQVFDKRFRVYKAAQAYLTDAIQGKNLVSAPSNLEFMLARDEAKFLFDDETNIEIEELYKACFEYHSHRAILKMKLYDEETMAVEAKDVKEREKDLYNRASNIADIFGPQIAIIDKPFKKRMGKSRIEWGTY